MSFGPMSFGSMSFGLTAATSAAPNPPSIQPRVPREEVPQYQPPPLGLELISPDRVPWIRPPPVEVAQGNGKWEKWVQYENSTTNPPSLYIRKRAHKWRPHSKHSVWYGRKHRRELYLRADFQVPLGVVEVEPFGSPAPRDLYYESEHHAGMLNQYSDVRLTGCTVLGTPMKMVARSASYNSDEDDDGGGNSEDDEPSPAAPTPVVRVDTEEMESAPAPTVVHVLPAPELVVDVALEEIEVDGPHSSPSAAPQGRAAGDETKDMKPVVDVPSAPIEEMEVDAPASSPSAAPRGRSVEDEGNVSSDEDIVSLGPESEGELVRPDEQKGRDGELARPDQANRRAAVEEEQGEIGNELGPEAPRLGSCASAVRCILLRQCQCDPTLAATAPPVPVRRLSADVPAPDNDTHVPAPARRLAAHVPARHKDADDFPPHIPARRLSVDVTLLLTFAATAPHVPARCLSTNVPAPRNDARVLAPARRLATHVPAHHKDADDLAPHAPATHAPVPLFCLRQSNLCPLALRRKGLICNLCDASRPCDFKRRRCEKELSLISRMGPAVDSSPTGFSMERRLSGLEDEYEEEEGELAMHRGRRADKHNRRRR
ncbi:hypothetical protein B0H19DRAFT_1274974 [Mycena capillaripes]|nr:hypothetical protein B0H19DRAFT_1274974 [Mycena capillaripes]